MTLNKYYTPEIEEFFHGFEYEVWENSAYTNESWIKKIFQFRDNNYIYKDTSFIIAEFEQRGDDIRVKYLDQEDIESLGFTDKPTAVNQKFSYYKFLKENQVCQITVYWDMNRTERENLIRIFRGTLHHYPYTEIFRGNIKNKSELKKLLKQLNIDDTK